MRIILFNEISDELVDEEVLSGGLDHVLAHLPQPQDRVVHRESERPLFHLGPFELVVNLVNCDQCAGPADARRAVHQNGQIGVPTQALVDRR